MQYLNTTGRNFNTHNKGNYKYTEEQIKEVVRLSDAGYSYKEITQRTGVKESSI